jgi:predicted nucleic acid-binding protein
MDAIGLVLVFIPGVIAFGVDYYNGTLFYPESEGRAAAGRLKRVPLPGSHPSKEQIAQAISAASGKQITLQDGTFVTQSLNTLDDFWSTHQQLLARVEQGDLVIRCQSPSL